METTTWDRLISEFALDMQTFENFRESSIKTYKMFLGKFKRAIQKDVANITEIDLQRWKIDLLKQDVRKNTQRLEHSVMKKFFEWYSRKYKAENPAKNFRPIQEEIRDPFIPTVAEVALLITSPALNTFVGRRDGAIISLFAGTGLRRSEMVLLNYEDITVISGKEFEVDIPTKKTRSRRVPFGSIKQHDIIASTFGLYYLELQSRYNMRKKDPLFFDNRKGVIRRLSKSWIPQIVTKYAAKLGKKITSKTLRHFFATYMSINGCNLKLLQYYMGHALLSTTERYIHLGDRVQSNTSLVHPLSKIKRPELTKLNQLIKEL